MIHSNSSVHPQPSPPRSFFCCWDWCRLTFPTVDELASHVRHNHISKLQPMSKKEIMLMRKQDAEEAQSISVSSGSSVPVHHSNGRSQLTRADSTDQGSSGSPPVELSRPPPSQVLSPGPLTPPTTYLPASSPLPEQTPPPLAVHGAVLHQPSPVLQTAPARGHGFPSFAQLSSPADTSSIASLPRSPDLSTLSLRPNVAAQIDAFDRRHSRLSEIAQAHPNIRSLDHSRSHSSSSSQDAVEQQLTREDVMDVSAQIQAPEVVHNGAVKRAALSTSEDPATIITSTIVDGADADLQWPESEPEYTPRSQPRQLSPPIEREEAERMEYRGSPVVTQNDRGRTFRSGTLHISPLPKHTVPGPALEPSQSSQDSQETSNSGVSQSSAHSYPLVLQTQAPYQSQSYDLSQNQA
ncbi:uncharacterized protein EDB91DRAFT_1077971 [Suillus paluster]|uniref:uncharacterized protein n=1 Tax=Suillus paluster TaxID=48578 RepID=UPI001B877ACC|nr:uncharacterized protein EDB91DRAFT_1077971 [Suillus paluster]KAG1752630.1 hypothetical protein EDB91DRAFT_1077971 [Suillus paluster]